MSKNPILASALVLAVVAAACSDGTTATPPAAKAAAGQALLSQEGLGAAINRDLATLRQVTAAYHDFTTATQAGWSVQLTPCMATPDGGMGYHYANPQYLGEIPQVDHPQLLLYEPEKNGQMRLVGVEYILPHEGHPTAPTLFGRTFTYVPAFDIWGLHAWVWKDNPSGMFADWNPTVGCDAA